MITEKCGLTLTASHCNVVLVGEKLIESGETIKVLTTLMKNTYVNDNAYVFACKGEPKEILGSTVAFGQNAGSYLQQLITMYGTYENIAYKTIRQVLVEDADKGATTYMPFVTKETIPAKIPDSSSYEEQKEKDDNIFNLNAIVVLKNGEKLGVYGENEVRSINLVMTEVHKGSESFDIGRGEADLFLLNSKAKTETDIENKTVKINLEIGVTVKEIRLKEEKGIKDFTEYTLTNEEIKKCEEKIKEEIEKCFGEMKELNADVFSIKQKFYSKYGAKADNIALNDLTLSVTVTITPER